MHSIKYVATKFQITYDTLRYYEKCGLLTDIKRNSAGQRVYTDEQVETINKIIHLRKLGASIIETKHFAQILSNTSDKTIYIKGLDLLDQLEKDLNTKINDLQAQKIFLQTKREHIKQQLADL